MAPVFYHFPDEPSAHDDAGRYMLGPDLLVSPVLQPDAQSMSVALPAGSRWIHVWTGRHFEGGTSAEVDCPWGQCPVFVREQAAGAFAEAFPALNSNQLS